MERKRFEIRAAPRKKFEIRDDERSWFRQSNEYDCGPCLLLNALHSFHDADAPKTVEAVRDEVNRLREEHHRRSLSRTEWFTSEDVADFFRSRGFEVKEYGFYPDAIAETMQSIRADLREPFELLYQTAGSHFKALIPSGNGYALQDSFNERPELRDVTALDQFLSDASRVASNQRVERIGIVRLSR